MGYIYYEDYKLRETSKSFYISAICDEEIEVRIEKDLIAELNLQDDDESVATLLGVIELIRVNNSERPQKKIINKEQFKENIRYFLNEKGIDDLIDEISGLRYFELKEKFIETPEDDNYERDEEESFN